MRRALLLVTACCLACVSLSAGPILTFTYDPSGYVDSVGDQTVGWSFNVVAPITVTQLMWFDPDGSQVEAHQVGIFAGSGATPVVQACIGVTAACATPSVWDSVTKYWTLSVTSTPLTAGSYVIGGKITLNENFVWVANAVATNPSITYGTNRYINGPIALTNPTQVLAAPPGGSHLGFFGPNFGTGEIPEPGTLALLGGGLLLLGALRRKRNAA